MQDFPRNICFSVYFCFCYQDDSSGPCPFPDIFHMASLAQRMSHCEQKHLKIWVKLTLFANPGMQLPNIPQCFIQNRNLHISDQNGALWVIEQVHSGICVGVAPHMEGTLHFGLEYYDLTQGGTALF